MTRWHIAAAILTASVFFDSTCMADEAQVSVVEIDPETGLATAVRVDGAALAHTSQLLPVDGDGNPNAAGDAAAQTEALLAQLGKVLDVSGAKIDDVVKLNVYLADDRHADAVRTVLRKQLAPVAQPAVSFVSGALSPPGVLVALDAVSVVPDKGLNKVSHFSITEDSKDRPSTVSILPRGGVVYISGQAEKGDDLAGRTRNTLSGLQRTLEFLGLQRADVVQLKSFLHPMSDLPVVEREIAAHFEGGPIPAHVPVEWTSEDNIEIELVAYLPPDSGAANKAALTFSTPPWMTSSPVFSRLAVVGSGPRVYISGLYGDEPGAQIPDIFARLSAILKKADSDVDHLAKATYYVADAEVSRELNEYRPKVYNPERPPAASKAAVRGVGRAGRTVTLDMIAVIPSKP